MIIVELNKNSLDIFLKKQKHSSFLQSWEWGEMQENSGNKVFKLGVEKNGELIAVAMFIKKNIGVGKNYFYCPRGPIFSESQIEEIENFLFKEIKKISKKENVIFLRFEPEQKRHDSLFKIYGSIPLQPAKTLMLDLKKTEDDLLGEMHKKTRYNIRLAEKKGVNIIQGNSDNFEKFWELISKTSDRDKFRIHSKTYYKNLLNLNFVKLYFAEYNNKNIATGLFTFYGDTVTYMHGASDNENRNVMAPFFLQWKLITWAKKDGFKYYDFYGIDENKWPGVTRFKRGFGGFEKGYSGTLDLVFNPLCYNVYKLLRVIRRMF